ncbi:hypothetical protein BDV93DRAFT_512737 [Ceratobasidium sp. AG-I]|nr:hypothetical protein BDV93DRAFT_512737 [Ceratobasidium sp. AG-I]
MFLVALCFAEVYSAYPTMGGLYYWVFNPTNLYSGKSLLILLGQKSLVAVSGRKAMIFVGPSGHPSTTSYGIDGGSQKRVTLIRMWRTLLETIVLVVTLFLEPPAKNFASFVLGLENSSSWGNRGFVVLLGFLQARGS